MISYRLCIIKLFYMTDHVCSHWSIDIDECAEDDLNSCSRSLLLVCRNLIGSYECNCVNSSYTMVIDHCEGTKCQKMNEKF